MSRFIQSWLPCAVVALALAGCSNGSVVKDEKAAAPRTDILAAGDGVLLGSGWYPLEHFEGKTFRWVKNDAEFVVCPDASHHDLTVDMEPGPSSDPKHFALAVIAGGKSIQTLDVPDHRPVVISLPANQAQTITLHASSPNRAVPHEKRLLNFRVFSAGLGSPRTACPPGIVHDNSQIELTKNWYGVETSGADSFRWVNNDAAVTVRRPIAAKSALEVDVEPGPGLSGKPLTLSVLDGSKEIAKSPPVTFRQIVVLPLQAPIAAGKTLTLHVSSPGRKVHGDPRTLNYRVFDIRLRPAT